MLEKIEDTKQKAFLSWGKFWRRFIVVLILYIVLDRVVGRSALIISIFTYLAMWVIITLPAVIISRVVPRFRALPLSHVFAKVAPYVLIPCALGIYGAWYGGR
jgi:succinate-acetate transporter protein